MYGWLRTRGATLVFTGREREGEGERDRWERDRERERGREIGRER